MIGIVIQLVCRTVISSLPPWTRNASDNKTLLVFPLKFLETQNKTKHSCKYLYTHTWQFLNVLQQLLQTGPTESCLKINSLEVEVKVSHYYIIDMLCRQQSHVQNLYQSMKSWRYTNFSTSFSIFLSKSSCAHVRSYGKMQAAKMRTYES